jgi:enterochelin esterase family protein
MRCLLKVGTLLLFASLACSQTFNAFVSRVYSSPESLRTAIVDSFMSAVPDFPYTEQDTVCHFIYRGTATAVTVPGDANEWNPSAFSMSRLSTTNLWFFTRNFESDARLDYKFVINGSNWITDPRNPHSCTGGFGPNSELRMPAYAPSPYVIRNPNIAHGTLVDTTFFSSNLNNSRRIRVYLPAGYDTSSQRYGLILFHDGLEYISLAHADNVLDNLIAAGSIRPTLAVFVPPVNRSAEYDGNQQALFTAFIASEVMPWVDSRFRTVTDPHQRGMAGASSGGDIALWISWSHPELFGMVAAQSPYVGPNVFNGFVNEPVHDLKVYLDVGTYDIAELIPMARSLAATLENRGYDYVYQELHEGHSWCNWSARIDDYLLLGFGAENSAPPLSAVVPQDYALNIYPNPFNATTTVSFYLNRPERVRIDLFDITGRHVKSYEDSVRAAGEYRFTVDGSALSTGVYFLRLQVHNRQITRKVLLLK